MDDIKKIDIPRRKWLKIMGTGTTVSVAGCVGGDGSSSGGSAQNDTNGSSASGSSNQKNVDSISLLTWNLSFMEDSIKNGWIKDFKESGEPVKQGHSNVSVGWSDKKGEKLSTYYLTQLQSNSPVTVIDTQGSVYSRFASEGVLSDLKNYTTDEFLKPLDKTALDYSKLDEKLYRMPFYQNTTVTYARKKWFDEANIDKYPNSTEEFFNTAEKLADNSDAEYGLTFLKNNYRIWPFFWADGVNILDDKQEKAAFNTKRAVRIVKRFRELTDDGVIPKVTWTGEVTPQNKEFGTGSTGMFLATLSSVRRVKSYSNWINTDTFDLFPSPGNKGAYVAHGLSITSKGTSKAKRRVAWDLIRTVLSEKWQKDLLEKTTVIGVNESVQNSLTKDKSFKQKYPLKVMAYNIWPKLAEGAVMPPTISASSQISNILKSQITSAALGEKSPQNALDTAEKEANDAIK